ncbi:Alpha/Beta hydrolase protein [Massariosphaeria phaeospora]|uniref:Alpha/Beta hydrolase protein n=1 Tax=Massariosphaeria phaeospora TaxID=100035 RepID=A0A7C8IHK0_9PLEO|nr:Alpha/Beta hydrolase protein [Massariosphaeria phaeospora]
MSSSVPRSNPTLVNIGTHSLALYTHGPKPASFKDPAVLFVSGVASSSHGWAAVIRLLPPSLRSYTYDRSGCGSSELSPLAPTAENIALELSRLIEHAPIENPLIIVGHSWAGVLAREFVLSTGNGPHIAGLVLVDANQENSLKEWDAFVCDETTEKFKQQGEKEKEAYVPSFETLQKKGLENLQPLLGNNPVYVVGGMRSRDWSRLYEAGIEKGNGTKEQRSHASEMIRTADEKSHGLMKEHLDLSTKRKLVFARESGHFVQLTQPDFVVDGVSWVLDRLQFGP